MSKIWVFDVDGTIADLSHRLQYVQTSPKNWKAFELGYVFDEPIQQTISVLNALRASGDKIVIVTARMGSTQGREDTQAWLEHHGIKYDAIFMREDQDYRDDAIIKEELIDIIENGIGKIFGVFDDRSHVVEMWRKRGIFVFDVNQSGKVY